jgi:hypothetical protein
MPSSSTHPQTLCALSKSEPRTADRLPRARPSRRGAGRRGQPWLAVASREHLFVLRGIGGKGLPKRHSLAAQLDDLSLATMLSAALVAFTIECDNELELRVAAARPIPSLVVWLNLLQYLREGSASVGELCVRSHTSIDQVRFLVGKLEHWAILSVAAKAGASRRPMQNEAAGRRPQNISAVKEHSVVGLGERVKPAVDLWPDVIDEVESRWRQRHGSALAAALQASSRLADRAGVLMPDGVPIASANRVGARDWRHLPPGKLEEPGHMRVPVLLSRALQAVTIAYEELSPLPLALAANTLRVVEDAGTPLAELHTRSGTAAETAASQATVLTKRLGLAEIVKDPGRRGRLLRLTATGKEAQAGHAQVIKEVEASLDRDAKTAGALRDLLAAQHDGDLAICSALMPPPGTRRFSTEAVVGRPVDSRDHQIVAQTEAFRSDPFRALPHYPVWEATRGFRP